MASNCESLKIMIINYWRLIYDAGWWPQDRTTERFLPLRVIKIWSGGCAIGHSRSRGDWYDESASSLVLIYILQLATFLTRPVYLCHVHNEAGGRGAEASTEQVPRVSQSEARIVSIWPIRRQEREPDRCHEIPNTLIRGERRRSRLNLTAFNEPKPRHLLSSAGLVRVRINALLCLYLEIEKF